MNSADAILWIQDATRPPDEFQAELSGMQVPRIVVRNKIDLSGDPAGRSNSLAPTINLSAKTGAGIDALQQAIRELAGYEDLGEGAFTARRRHIDALQRAAGHFRAGVAALEDSRAGELLAEELRLAQQALAGITGSFSSDDLLGRIFSEFCIGK